MNRQLTDLYTYLRSWGTASCVYCNQPAEKLDYAPPLRRLNTTKARQFLGRGGLMWKVPCCADCSLLLEGCTSPYLGTRVEFLKNELWRHNEKVMMQKPHEREELEALAKQFSYDPGHPVHYQLTLWKRFEYLDLAQEKLKEF